MKIPVLDSPDGTDPVDPGVANPGDTSVEGGATGSAISQETNLAGLVSGDSRLYSMYCATSPSS